MDSRNSPSEVKGTIFVFISTLIWSSSFIVTKDAASSLPTFMLVAIRMLLGGVFVAFLCRKEHYKTSKKLLEESLILAVMYLSGMVFQTEGLRYSSSGKVAFITNAYCFYMPFMEWIILGKKPTLKSVLCGLLCMIGIGLVALTEEFTIDRGDAFSLVASICFGFAIVFMGKFVKDYDAALLNMYELLISGVILALLSAFTETMPETISSSAIISILYLSIACSGLALLLRSKALEAISPTRAVLIGGFEPVFAVIIGALIGSETFTARCITGFVLIMLAVIIDGIDLKKVKS